jgi:hypothetical protein
MEKKKDLEKKAQEWVEKHYPGSMYAEHAWSIALHAFNAGFIVAEG